MFLTETFVKKLEKSHRAMEMNILHVKYTNRNFEIRQRTTVSDVAGEMILWASKEQHGQGSKGQAMLKDSGLGLLPVAEGHRLDKTGLEHKHTTVVIFFFIS